MIVFYANIIDRIITGSKHKYSKQMLHKLREWAENDTRTNAETNKENKF